MLHFAVCYKRAEIVKYLIENGASKSNSYVTESAKTVLNGTFSI